jgi:uncharacterized protein GlcG (DUF336 family)
MVRLIALLPFVAAVLAEVGNPKGESLESMMEYTYDLAEGNESKFINKLVGSRTYLNADTELGKAELEKPTPSVQAPYEAHPPADQTIYTDLPQSPEYANPESVQAPAQPAQQQAHQVQQGEQAEPGVNTVQVISSAQAQEIVAAAVKKATENKNPSNIAIVDPFGHLVAFTRMDGAPLVSIDVALKKAKTVSMFGGKFRTGDLMNATLPGGQFYGIERTNSGLIFFGMCYPICRSSWLVFGAQKGELGGSWNPKGIAVTVPQAIHCSLLPF